MFCKLAGLITRARPNWTAEDLKPYVEHVVELFGYDRLMFGSDWPVCLMAGSYSDVVGALREVLGPLREDDAAKVWGETAREFYQLG
jgi:L-fuconolactonase